MLPSIRNVIIFVAIGGVFVLIYIFFIKSPPEKAPLVTSAASPETQVSSEEGNTSQVAQDFLTLLLNIKNIKLDDSIFSDAAFMSLHDGSITLVPEGNEGRVNPFAPIGADAALPVEFTGASEAQ